MMRALYQTRGAEFSVDILADPAVSAFIDGHAVILDSAFDQTKMSETLRSRLRSSDWVFSGMKTFHELNEAFPSLLDENGVLKPFERFLNDVRSIDRTYNSNYLRAEYNFVTASAQMAAKWEEFQSDGDRYNLQYRTQKDGRVRPEHAALHGVTLPPSDPFWEEFYPPNGWNCFTGQTPVLTASGWKRICEVRRGDLVFGGSGQLRKTIGIHSKSVYEELICIVAKGAIATCTKNHRFCTRRGWVIADDLKPGDIIIQIAKNSPLDKIINAVSNSVALVKQALMSYERKRKSITSLTIDNEFNGRNDEIDNIGSYDLTRLKGKGFLRKIVRHDFFGFAQWLSDRTHSFGMCPSGSLSCHTALHDDFRAPERRRGFKFLGNTSDKFTVLFGLSLPRMSSFKCKTVINFRHILSGFKSAIMSANPLSFDSCTPFPARNATGVQNLHCRSHVDMPMITEPSQAALLNHIPLFHGISKICSFNGFDSFLDMIRRSLFHTRYVIIEDKIKINKGVYQVFNLSVEEDESYIVPVGIAHNCRCDVVQVRKSKYPQTDHDEAVARGEGALRKDTRRMFRFNPGAERSTVPAYNPYTISRCRDCDITKGKLSLARATPPDSQLCAACRFLRSCENDNSYYDDSELGSRLKINKNADKNELKPNRRAAAAILKSFPEANIKIRPHVIEENVKNPEYSINGLIADRKGVESEKGITAGFKKAIKQGCQAVVIDFDMNMKQQLLKTNKAAQYLDGRKKDFERGVIKICYMIHKDRAIKIEHWKSRKDLILQIKKLEDI